MMPQIPPTYTISTPGNIVMVEGPSDVVSWAAPTAEVDPNGKGTHELGAKLDFGKPPVFRGALSYFPRSIAAIARVSAVGARKYAWKGWESVDDGFNRYSDALARHILAESREDVDQDTGCLHAEQVAWNACARLELLLKEREIRDKG